MISNDRETRIISTLSYVDRDSFVVWDTDANRQFKIEENGGYFHSARRGTDDHFSIVQQRREGGFSVTARHMDRPERVIARIDVHDLNVATEGDAEIWKILPSVCSGYSKPASGGGEFVWALVTIDPSTGASDVHQMDWMSEFDSGWQSMGDPVEVPGSQLVLISVQRSSGPIVWDVVENRVRGRIKLADRGGNDRLAFRTRDELWADDYDTVLRLRHTGSSWEVSDSVRLQDAIDGIGHPIGTWAFDRDRASCIVSRPYAGDVVALDCTTFAVSSRTVIGGQPLCVALFSDGRVFARDGRTGDPLVGALKLPSDG